MTPEQTTRPNDAADLEVRFVAADGPEVRPLLADLERENDDRYHDLLPEPAAAELSRYAPELFAAPQGAFVVLLQHGTAIAGGAFMPYSRGKGRDDVDTVEVKRVWTSPDHRGRGLAKRVLAELEAEAVRRGFARIYLTTGPRQPEAVRLYLGASYTPLFDIALPAEEVGIHPFAKILTAHVRPEPPR
jgi:polar amino acid transport system permease protein